MGVVHCGPRNPNWRGGRSVASNGYLADLSIPEIAKLELAQFDHPALRRVCDLVPRELDDPRKLDVLVGRMRQLCRLHHGVGLAAPQIGLADRVILVLTRTLKMAMVNPRIDQRSRATEEDTEGCLSYPGTWVRVRRHVSIQVEWDQGPGDTPSRGGFSGYDARVIQHEVDHLDGVCRVGDEWRRQQATRQEVVHG